MNYLQHILQGSKHIHRLPQSTTEPKMRRDLFIKIIHHSIGNFKMHNVNIPFFAKPGNLNQKFEPQFTNTLCLTRITRNSVRSWPFSTGSFAMNSYVMALLMSEIPTENGSEAMDLWTRIQVKVNSG